jgi:uncharacterized Ntn-hydrolase superfamily protein
MKILNSSESSRLAAAFGLATLLLNFDPARAQAPLKPGPRFHTRSIVACDPASGQCGIAVISFPSGVPAVVPVGEAGVMVANQAFPSFATARAIIDKIKAGADAPTALAEALVADPDRDFRQFGVAALRSTSPSGVTVATFTGLVNDPETCSITGTNYAVQANTQTTSNVCSAMAAGFEAAKGSLPRRLLAVLKAGGAVGGDLRGEFSASIRVFSESWELASITPIIADAGVNRAADPLVELEYNLNAYLGVLTAADPADQVELSSEKAKEILKVLRDLGFYKGVVDGRWSPEAEAALEAFSTFNLFFLKPTTTSGGKRFIDAPLADYLVAGAVRNVLTANPN